MAVSSLVEEITARIVHRSTESRSRYLARLEAAAASQSVYRQTLPCANQAHAWAAMPGNDKLRLREMQAPNLGIVTAYNDMLSAHQPYADYPEQIKAAARAVGATAQVAGGVPAMCDGVTQGLPGMELSLFSRDVIAMSTAIALSHNVFDAAVCLGICDKIVPGLLMGALQFGHLPAIFVPAGPMGSGISNSEKNKTRQLYAQGKVGQDALLASEEGAYHSAGTCTFYGTANSNQMLMEIMGLHLPGSSFVHPQDPLRHALTVAAAQRAAAITRHGNEYTPVGKLVDEKVIVNGMVGLLATGGSTNHTMHLVAIARAAGIVIDWSDFSALSAVVPLLARVYPNGPADVNQFHEAGGMSYLIRELLAASLLHEDVHTVAGPGLARYAQAAALEGERAVWQDIARESGSDDILRPASRPFSLDGGLRLLQGNLGRSVTKISAVKPEHQIVEAPALVFDDQSELLAAFKEGALEKDFVAVVRFQGPRANGMPELHKLVPALSVLQDKGFKVALVTDGRMSGASGKVPTAIHITPEVVCNGPLGKVRSGDIIRLDAQAGTLNALVAAEEWATREIPVLDGSRNSHGGGRELFAVLRANATSAEDGAISLGLEH
ncbi:MAG: phosphogluconate dehydratase [Proteobacteria bacterium]|nr:phosphogluconate dehydratase [Pseudomonadota bacterium]